MENKVCLELINVAIGFQKSKKSIPIFKNINLQFVEGEIVGIVGLNGVGKSTLLKSICGLIPLLEGDVKIHERAIKSFSLKELSKKISCVLTEKISGFNLTARDLVATGQIPLTNAFYQLKKQHHQVIDATIKKCGLEKFQYKLLDELSDGMFQKTIIAKSLAQQTPLLLLDEPTAFLDFASKHDLFLLLKQLSEVEKKCILISSHDLELLLKYCNRLLILSESSIELIPTDDAKKNINFININGGYL